MRRRDDNNPIGNQALGNAFLAYVDAAYARNPERSWNQGEYDAEALEQAEEAAVENLHAILAARKAQQ